MSLATDTIKRTILKVNATHCNGPEGASGGVMVSKLD